MELVARIEQAAPAGSSFDDAGTRTPQA